MVLVLIVNFAATVIVNSMWDSLWDQVGGDEDEEGFWLSGGDSDFLIMVYNRGVERIWNFLIIYFILILILSAIEIIGAFMIFKGSSDFGERHNQMGKWGFILLIFWYIFDHILGTFGSSYSVATFNILGSLAFTCGIILLVYNITAGKDRIVLMTGGIIFLLGKTLGSFFYQWAAITGSVISSVGMISIIITYSIILIKIDRPDFSISEYCKQKIGRTRETSISGKPLQRVTEQEKVFAAYITPFETKKEAQQGLTIDMFSEKFNISEHHAALIYDAGYISVEDLKFATIEELLFVDGMNPTVARKIIDKN